MPGPTTERLDEDFRAMREEFQDFKVILARMDAKLSTLDDLKLEFKVGFETLRTEAKENSDSLRLETKKNSDSLRAEVKADFRKVQDDLKLNMASIAALDLRISKVDGLFNGAKWVLTTFALGGILGVINISGRLIALELQSKSVETRLNAVETEIKGLTKRQDVVEFGLQGVQTDLGAVKGAIERRAPDTAAELDDSIKQIARSMIEESARQTPASKP